MTSFSRRVILRSRPVGAPTADNFAIDQAPLPALEPGEFLLRNLYVSLDPGIRQRLSQVDSYVKLIGLDEALTSTTLGEVIASRDPSLQPGDHVVGFHTVSDYSVTRRGPLTRKVDLSRTLCASNHLSVLGMTGLTAYFGLLDIGMPRPGETVMVSAAAGAVGSVASQIAKIKGCRVVGIAGGPEKCATLVEEFGLDAAIDYQQKDIELLSAAMRENALQGVDVFFDNVGGIQLDAALACMNNRGRIALCGLIAQYNLRGPPPPLTNLFKLIAKSVRMEGFVVLTYAERFHEGLVDLERWVKEGKLIFREQIEEGLDRAVPAFLQLFDGSNRGKVILRLSES